MKSINLLIFDLDGTLVNTLGDITASVNYTLAHFGKQPLDTNIVRRFVGDGTKVLVERALGGRSAHVAEAVNIYKDHHRRNLVFHSTLYPSVKDTLEYFKDLPMAVITNKSSEFCGPLLERLGIAQNFKMVVGADYGLPLKPAPDAVLKIMAEYNVSKERTVIVGDSLTDINAGKAASVITCAVTYGFCSEDDLVNAGPDFLIRHFSELKNLFTPMKP